MHILDTLTTYQISQLTRFGESSVGRPHLNPWSRPHTWSVTPSKTGVQELKIVTMAKSHPHTTPMHPQDGPPQHVMNERSLTTEKSSYYILAQCSSVDPAPSSVHRWVASVHRSLPMNAIGCFSREHLHPRSTCYSSSTPFPEQHFLGRPSCVEISVSSFS